MLLDLDRRVEVDREAGLVRELDRDLAAGAQSTSMSPPGASISLARHGLDHLHDARLERDRRDADRVRAGHRRVLGALEDHVAEVGAGIARGQDDVRVHVRRATRLEEEQAADLVELALQVLLLLEHRGARHVDDPARDDVADLALGVAADDRGRPLGAPSRRPCSRRRRARSCRVRGLGRGGEELDHGRDLVRSGSATFPVGTSRSPSAAIAASSRRSLRPPPRRRRVDLAGADRAFTRMFCRAKSIAARRHNTAPFDVQYAVSSGSTMREIEAMLTIAPPPVASIARAASSRRRARRGSPRRCGASRRPTCRACPSGR